MAYVIDVEPCINCGWCRTECPTQAVRPFFRGRPAYAIDADWCIDCDICAQVCPIDCIAHHPEVQPAPAQLERAKERARVAGRLDGPARRAGVRRPPWLRPPRESRP